MVAILILIGALTMSAFADDFDGSKPLSGITGRIIEINQYKIIDNVDPYTIGLPKNFTIDFNSNQIRPSEDSRIRKNLKFIRVDHIENKIVIQGVDEGIEGVEDGLAWSITISKKDGKSVLSASGDGVAFVVFGVCKPIKDKR